MHYKSFNIFIQYHFSKLFFIDKLYFSGGRQSLFGNVEPLG